MLPTINLDLAQVAVPVFEFLSGRHTFIGRSFAYHSQPLKAAAVKANKSLDRILTEGVLEGFTANPSKTRVLISYAPLNEIVILTVCDVREKVRAMWLRRIPGYFECGRDYVPPNAQPFLYWNGANLTRLYIVHESLEPGQSYLSDFGALTGLMVGRGVEFAVDAVREHDPAYLEYSIVPEDPEEVLTIGDRKCVLSHALCSLTQSPSPEDEFDENE